VRIGIVGGLAIAAAMALGSSRVNAELEIPRRSPRARVSQHVGLTEITVEYNSPAVRGRSIWGTAVPYGEIWRAEDTPAARISFSREVVFGGQVIPAGTYSLLVIPAPGDWTLVLNRDPNLVETGRDHDANQDLARIAAHSRPAPHRERLTFLFSDFSDEQATLDLEWEKRRVSVPIQLETRAQIVSGIKALDGVWRDYANVASYMLKTKKDYDAGLRYIDRSLALSTNWNNLWVKASLLAAKGRYHEARDQAETAYRLGHDLDDQSFPEPDVRRALAEWDAREARPLENRRASPSSRKMAREMAKKTARETAKKIARADPDVDVEPPTFAANAASSTVAVAVHDEMAVSSLGDSAGAKPASEVAPPPPPPPPPPTPTIMQERPVSVHHPARGPGNSKAPPPTEITPVIERGRSEIQTCYQRALRLDPTLTRGRISITLSIGVSGAVKSVVFDSPERFRSVEPCIKEAVSRWVFPSAPVEYGAELPIVLQGNE
jgi:tetratricopeptide (TPR) repeat protein